MAIDKTVGGVSANSYVDADDADAFFADALDASAWTDAGSVSPSRQEPALIAAALRLNQEAYRGTKTDADQALAFPRDSIEDEDGNEIGNAVIPERVKRAQMKLALAMLRTTDFLQDTGLEGFRRASVGPLSVEPNPARSAGTLPADVRRELRPFLTGSAYNFQLVRGG